MMGIDYQYKKLNQLPINLKKAWVNPTDGCEANMGTGKKMKEKKCWYAFNVKDIAHGDHHLVEDLSKTKY